MMDDRAVSEVVGFAIIFGIIIASVGLLYVVGFQAMVDFQEGEQMSNAERAFDVMAENFNDVQRDDGITARSSEINLRGGTIETVTDGTTMNVTLGGTNVLREHGDEEHGGDLNGEIGAFTYTKDDTTLAYHGGGVFRAESRGNVTVTDPMITCWEDDETAVVSLVVVDGDGERFRSSDVQEITATQQGNTTVVTASGEDVTIEIEDSPYQSAWNRTLQDNGWSGGDGTWTCEAERATVRITTLEIDYN